MTQMNRVDIILCAQAGHEMVRIYSKHLGDDTHKPWEHMTDDEKRPAVLSALNLLNKDYTPEQIHNDWVAERVASGWTLGDTKDVEKKIHPDLIGWDKLPPDQAFKNNLFCVAAKTMASALWRVPA